VHPGPRNATSRSGMSTRRCGRAMIPVALVAFSVVAACQPRVSERIFQGGRLGMVSLFTPTRTADALVFVFSDVQGWDAAYAGAARRLAGTGAVVVGVDLPQYLRNLAASKDGCHYVIAEIEDMSERLQRDLHFAGYQSPILAGIGAGGTLAYAALAQSPAATIAGAISVDPAPALRTRVPLCAGAPAQAESDGFVYGAQPKLNGWWRTSTAAPLAPALAAVVEQSSGAVADVRGEPFERLLMLVRTAVPSPVPSLLPVALAQLPLTELPALQPGPAMAVIYSGDGGWRDIDKQIGEVLARMGMPVVGVDSLRYFWRAQTPAEIAGDLSQIIRHYGDTWRTRKVVLVGYSFGAGILPFALNRLQGEDRARVVQVSLLGLEPRADFQVKLSGWFGAEPSRDAPAVLPEILRQPLGLFQCFYGEKEDDTLCTAPELAGAEIIRTTGGHHFGGDYSALAERIHAGAARRLHAIGENP
jgi:type IV secretory pathway VirJ component